MKHLSFLIIGILFLLLVAGCGKTSEVPATGPTDTPEAMPLPGTPPPGY